MCGVSVGEYMEVCGGVWRCVEVCSECVEVCGEYVEVCSECGGVYGGVWRRVEVCGGVCRCVVSVCEYEASVGTWYTMCCCLCVCFG